MRYKTLMLSQFLIENNINFLDNTVSLGTLKQHRKTFLRECKNGSLKISIAPKILSMFSGCFFDNQHGTCNKTYIQNIFIF